MTDPNEERDKQIIRDIYGLFRLHNLCAPEAIDLLINTIMLILKSATETLEDVEKEKILEEYIRIMREWK